MPNQYPLPGTGAPRPDPTGENWWSRTPYGAIGHGIGALVRGRFMEQTPIGRFMARQFPGQSWRDNASRALRAAVGSTDWRGNAVSNPGRSVAPTDWRENAGSNPSGTNSGGSDHTGLNDPYLGADPYQSWNDLVSAMTPGSRYDGTDPGPLEPPGTLADNDPNQIPVEAYTDPVTVSGNPVRPVGSGSGRPNPARGLGIILAQYPNLNNPAAIRALNRGASVQSLIGRAQFDARASDAMTMWDASRMQPTNAFNPDEIMGGQGSNAIGRINPETGMYEQTGMMDSRFRNMAPGQGEGAPVLSSGPGGTVDEYNRWLMANRPRTSVAPAPATIDPAEWGGLGWTPEALQSNDPSGNPADLVPGTGGSNDPSVNPNDPSVNPTAWGLPANPTARTGAFPWTAAMFQNLGRG